MARAGLQRGVSAWALCCLLSCFPLHSAGESGADFLDIRTAARAAAMGEAFVSLADDAACMQWNPAGLALRDAPILEFDHLETLADTSYERIAAVLPLSIVGSLGFSIHYSRVDDLFATDDSGCSEPVAIYDVVGVVGCARKARDGLLVGACTKLYHSYLVGSTATGLAFDLGALITVYDRFTIGGSVLNLGPEIKYERAGDPLPRWMKTGLTGCLFDNERGRMTITGEANLPMFKGGEMYTNLGTEYSFRRSCFVRLGSGGGAEERRLAFGGGIRHWNLIFNYAYVPYGAIGCSHSVSMVYDFGRKPGGEIVEESSRRPGLSGEETLVVLPFATDDEGRFLQHLLVALFAGSGAFKAVETTEEDTRSTEVVLCYDKECWRALGRRLQADRILCATEETTTEGRLVRIDMVNVQNGEKDLSEWVVVGKGKEHYRDLVLRIRNRLAEYLDGAKPGVE